MHNLFGFLLQQFKRAEDAKIRQSEISKRSGLLALFDNFFAISKKGERENLVRKVLDIDYEDSGLPSWYAENLKRAFEGMNFLQNGFMLRLIRNFQMESLNFCRRITTFSKLIVRQKAASS